MLCMKRIKPLRSLLPEDKQAQLRCEGEGLQQLLLRSSKKGLWRKMAPDEMIKQYKGQMSVSAELYFSPEQLKQRHVQQGKIKLYDAKGLYGTVVIDVINSRVNIDYYVFYAVGERSDCSIFIEISVSF